MFIATLFTIAWTWKQPRCPSTNEWIRKLWYIYTVEYSLASRFVITEPPGFVIYVHYYIEVCVLWLSWWLSSDESVCNAGDVGLISRSGRSPGEEIGNPLWYSCLENPMERGTCGATVYGVTESQTGLKWLNTHWDLRPGASSSGRAYNWL